MAGPIDEEFTEQHLRPGTVLEFGCSPGVFTSRIARRSELIVTGVDLYQAEIVEGFKFVHGDVMSLSLPTFDTVCCVSSFEHVGIESANFAAGSAPDLMYQERVAERLQSLVSDGGRMIITCPLGPDEIWLSRGAAGADLKYTGTAIDPSTQWGYRTFTVETLKRLFNDLDLVLAVGYEHVGGDYFKHHNWRAVDPVVNAGRYTSPNRRAVVGTLFERQLA